MNRTTVLGLAALSVSACGAPRIAGTGDRGVVRFAVVDEGYENATLDAALVPLVPVTVLLESATEKIPSGPFALTIDGQSPISPLQTRSDPATRRANELARFPLQLTTPGSALLEVQSNGSVIDSLTINAVTAEKLVALDAVIDSTTHHDSPPCPFDTKNQQLSVMPGSIARLRLGLRGARDESVLERPTLKRASTGNTTTAELPVSQDTVTLSWTPDFLDVLGDVFARSLTLGLVSGRSTTLKVQDTAGRSASISVVEVSSCPSR